MQKCGEFSTLVADLTPPTKSEVQTVLWTWSWHQNTRFAKMEVVHFWAQIYLFIYLKKNSLQSCSFISFCTQIIQRLEVIVILKLLHLSFLCYNTVLAQYISSEKHKDLCWHPLASVGERRYFLAEGSSDFVWSHLHKWEFVMSKALSHHVQHERIHSCY